MSSASEWTSKAMILEKVTEGVNVNREFQMLEHSQFKGWRSKEESTKETGSSYQRHRRQNRVVYKSQIKKIFNAAAGHVR